MALYGSHFAIVEPGAITIIVVVVVVVFDYCCLLILYILYMLCYPMYSVAIRSTIK